MRDLLIPYAVGEGETSVFPDQAFSGGNYHCPECKGAVGVRTPANRRAHFFHLPPHGICKLEPSGARGEGELHAFAKHCLYAWLDRWLTGELEIPPVVEGKCAMHGKKFTVSIPRPRPYKLLMEHTTPEGRRLDLAMLNSDGRITIGFEVRASNSVTADKVATLPARWLELGAASIVKAYKKLLSGQQPPAISLLRWAEYDQPSCCKVPRATLSSTWTGAEFRSYASPPEPYIPPPIREAPGDAQLMAAAGRAIGSGLTPQSFADSYGAETGQPPRDILSRLRAYGVAKSGWSWS
ncbi:competence protein CoiA family protein [Azospira restricta]|uniref:Competence protein CoiA n=1 Tax=Azospira restricta TaxID=404405 RepID=A0A974SRL9_9RHOO|nr:hypothetical protein IWH25_07510 [Azospira restricta]